MIRFVIGEAAAALEYIHESGFSYCDLKPENIVITTLGHVKVTAAMMMSMMSMMMTMCQ